MLLLYGFCVAEVFANHPDGDDGVDTEEEYALPTIHESDEMGETNIPCSYYYFSCLGRFCGLFQLGI